MYEKRLKGKFPQTTMWIGWVESKFRNPTVMFWANWIIHLKELLIKCKVLYFALSRQNYARICDITREQFSIDFVHKISKFLSFLGYQSSNWSSSIINACTIILALTYLSIKVEGRYIFMNSKSFVKFVYSSIRQLYCCDITDISTVPPERAAHKKLTKTLKNDSSWLDYPNLPKLSLLDF